MTDQETRYLLDTSIISEFAKDSCKQHAGLRNWLNLVPDCALYVPYGAALEIQRGIFRLRHTNPLKADSLDLWFDDLRTRIPFIPMTLEASRIHAEMTSERALTHLWINDPRKKRPRPSQALAIAATAITSGSCLVTRNVSAFELIDRYFPLPGLINPIDSDPEALSPAPVTHH
ncbi:PIN domain-containing protein [Roseibium sp. FZY0029]|uniref:PIN domain-containing protein n=1 Tax=Roseibium sp. FZY0029 TaxID=3116647 RepID=UPI002E9AB06B|nr:PIN domain-containing protein [Roseibium sp. FZY0029]